MVLRVSVDTAGMDPLDIRDLDGGHTGQGPGEELTATEREGRKAFLAWKREAERKKMERRAGQDGEV